MKNFVIVALFSLAFPATAAESLLFRWMEGCWEGEGQRVSAVSGRAARISAVARAVVQGDRLESRNAIHDEAAGKDYAREYWVRPKAGSLSEYALGSLGSEKAGSVGTFSAERKEFLVIQDLGGGLSVQSRTLFDPEAGRSVYVEQGFQEVKPLYEVRIEYRRAKLRACLKPAVPCGPCPG